MKRVLLFLIVGLLIICTTACDKKKEDTKKPYVKPNALETAENGEHYH